MFSHLIPFDWPLLSLCMTIGCFQWCRPQTSGRPGLSWGAISLHPEGHSFIKLLFILEHLLSHSCRISKVFFSLFGVISTVFWSALNFMFSLCGMCVCVWSVCVNAGTHKHIQSTTSAGGPCLAPHLRRLSWWWCVQQAAGLPGPVHSPNPASPLPEKCWDSRRASPHPAYMWAVGFWTQGLMLVADTLPIEPSPHPRSAFIFISHFLYLVFFF